MVEGKHIKWIKSTINHIYNASLPRHVLDSARKHFPSAASQWNGKRRKFSPESFFLIASVYVIGDVIALPRGFWKYIFVEKQMAMMNFTHFYFCVTFRLRIILQCLRKSFMKDLRDSFIYFLRYKIHKFTVAEKFIVVEGKREGNCEKQNSISSLHSEIVGGKLLTTNLTI